MFPRLDPYYADPAQPLATAGEELDDLDHDLSDLSEVCPFSSALYRNMYITLIPSNSPKNGGSDPSDAWKWEKRVFVLVLFRLVNFFEQCHSEVLHVKIVSRVTDTARKVTLRHRRGIIRHVASRDFPPITTILQKEKQKTDQWENEKNVGAPQKNMSTRSKNCKYTQKKWRFTAVCSTVLRSTVPT